MRNSALIAAIDLSMGGFLPGSGLSEWLRQNPRWRPKEDPKAQALRAQKRAEIKAVRKRRKAEKLRKRG